jgi:pimeloyl-ACP methyl ester carboxylesterase
MRVRVILLSAMLLIGFFYLYLPAFQINSVTGSIGEGKLHWRYIPGEIERGVILAHGFGSDSTVFESFLLPLKAMGYHIFTFDFSGHGRSGGGLGFDNAQTSDLANELQEFLAVFREQSGLAEGQIHGIGHSMGARVLLQLSGKELFRSLVLYGAQINMIPNAQSSFFTGTEDSDLPWVQALGPENPEHDLYLISGLWDDILPPEAAIALLDKLGAESNRRMLLLPGLVHSFEVFDPRAIDAGIEYLGEQDQLEAQASQQQKPYGWILILALGYLLLRSLRFKKPSVPKSKNERTIEGKHIRAFLGIKFLLWIPGLLVAVLLIGMASLIPAAFPAFTVYYFGFIAGYGITLLVLYRYSSLGKKAGIQLFPIESKGRLIPVIFSGLALTLFFGLLVRSGIFYIFPLNIRFIWLLIFAPLTAIGFYIGNRESMHMPGQLVYKYLLTLIQYFPFILLALLYLILASISGFIGLFYGLVVLMFLSRAGKILTDLGCNTLAIALMQGFVLQIIILPQGVLFTI